MDTRPSKYLPIRPYCPRFHLIGGTGHQAAHFATIADKVAAMRRAADTTPRTPQAPCRLNGFR